MTDKPTDTPGIRRVDSAAPTISVVIPMYNAAKYIERCLLSVTRQELLHPAGSDEAAGAAVEPPSRTIEIIVVDDGSTDEGAAVVERVAAAIHAVRIILIQQANRGPAAARNAGLTAASGEWVTFIDADDTIAAGTLGYLLAIAEANGCDVARCGLFRRSAGAESFPDPCAPMPGDVPVDIVLGIDLYQRLFDGPDPELMSACGALYRTDLLTGHGIRFDENLRHTEDALFCAEVYSLNRRCVLSPVKLYRYWATPNSLGSTYDAGLFHAADTLRERLTLFELEPGTRGDVARAGSGALRSYLGLYYAIALADEVAAGAAARDSFVSRAERITAESHMVKTFEELEAAGELGILAMLWAPIKARRWGTAATVLRAFNAARHLRRMLLGTVE